MTKKVARFLAIDLGDRRTGLALGDSLTNIVSPIGTIEATKGPALLADLKKTIDETGPDELVIGLPLNMDGSEGAARRSGCCRDAGGFPTRSRGGPNMNWLGEWFNHSLAAS